MKNLKLLLTLLMTIVIGTGTMWAADPVTVSVTIHASSGDYYASTHSWQNGGAQVYDQVALDANISVNRIGTGNNGKYYSDWRFYTNGSDDGSFSVDAANGATLNSVTFTYSVSNSGALYMGSTKLTSGTAQEISGSQVVFTCKNTNTSTNGQVRLTAVSVTYTPGVSTKCATPTFSIPEGTFYDASISVELACATTGADVYYTLDGSTPSSSSTKYTTAITIDATKTIKAIAVKSGLNDSEVASATYTKGDPVTSYEIDFETNNLAAYVNWEFSNLTIDDAITARGGTKYAKTNGTGTAAITTKEKIALPGTITYYISKVGTNTNANSKWKARVSSDGLTWTVVGDENAAGAGVTEGTWNACSADLSGYTDVYVQVYYEGTTAVRTIDDVLLEMRTPAAVEKPVISGQTPFYKNTHVTINCVTDGAVIYYTLDGSEPDPDEFGGSTNTYDASGINLVNTTTINAIAVKNSDRSEVVSKTFTKATVMTVAEALVTIDGLTEGGKTPDSVFVVGYVKSISEIAAGGYTNATYLIQDQGVDNELTVFRGKNVGNTDFTSSDELAVGDMVVIKGILQKYKKDDVITPEFTQGNYIVERVPKGGVVSIALDGELTKTSGYENGDIISVDGLTATATYESGFQEDVTALATWTVDGEADKVIYQESDFVFAAEYGGQSKSKVIHLYINTYAVTFADPANGSLVIKYAGSPISTGDEFTKNSVLTVEVTPDTGYQLETLTANGDDIKDTKSFTVVTENVVVAATFAEIQHVYSVVGNGAVIATGWDETATETEMTLNAGVYSYKVLDRTLQAGTPYEYKIVEDHSWDVSFPQAGNASFTVDKDGRYDVTFTLNESTKAYDAIPELKEEILLNRKFAVAGDFNSWANNPTELTPDAATASITISGLAKGDYAFKVIVNGAWLGNTQTFTRDNNLYAGIIANEDPDMTLHVDVPGDYVFTWTYETNKLEITYPAKPALPMEWSKKDGYTITYGDNIDASEYSRLMIAPSLQGLEITVTSDAPEVVEYNSKGYAVDGYTVYYEIHKAGVATITASFAGNEDYAETSVSYTLTVNKGDSKLEWSTTSFNANAKTDASEYPELSFAADIDVSKITYSSDNNEVATVDADGKVTLLLGDYAVLITATFAGDDKYENAEASYWLSTEKVNPVLDWSKSTASATIGGSNEFPTLKNEDGVPVTYSSDNEEAVYINPQTGEITLLQPGTVTISASFDGNGLFNSAYAEYTLTVAGEAVEEDILLGLDLSNYEYEINVGEALPKPTVYAHYYLTADKDVTAEATFDGVFDNAVPGTYTINVSYNDEKGQHAEATYTVKVKDTATAIGNAEMGEKAVKVIENNQVIIIKNGVKYNVIGLKLR